MKLAKSLLLGSAAALVATAGATAADLPSKKAAPVQYVKICDAYGSGFFNIPGSDTCVKIGGRVRADYSLSGKAASYANNVPAVWANGAAVNWTGAPGVTDAGATAASSTGGPVAEWGAVQSWNGAAYGANPSGSASTVVPNGYAKDAANMQGWEARARIDMDARTPTSYGTVQAVMSLRLARTTGVLAAGSGATASGASPTLEAAYIRFAGFTFGASRDNFSFMPSTFYGAGHWSSFANGAKQLAYTAVLGGGFSATLAMQDAADTTAGGVNARARVNQTTGAPVFFTSNSDFTWDEQARGLNSYASNTLPQINLRLDLDQSWGGVSLMGAVAQAVAVNPSASFNKNETVWAAGAGLKLNLPMIAAGDVLWLNAAYADGMTEYTTNWTSFKSSDTRSNVGGYQTNHPSWISGTSSTGVQVLETFKSWNAAAIFTHFWTPQWRHSFMGSYGAIEAPQFAKAQPFGYSGAFGDAKVWNVGTQLAWLPTRNFEIGVDVLYARVSQDVTRLDYGANAITSGQNTTAPAAVRTTRENAGNWTGRLRVERTF